MVGDSHQGSILILTTPVSSSQYFHSHVMIILILTILSFSHYYHSHFSLIFILFQTIFSISHYYQFHIILTLVSFSYYSHVHGRLATRLDHYVNHSHSHINQILSGGGPTVGREDQ